MIFVATIHVRPKSEVRDPQGEAVRGALRSLGLQVQDVRTGKEIVVTFEAADERAAGEAVRLMGNELLANPVIEDYAFELEQASPPALEQDPISEMAGRYSFGPVDPKEIDEIVYGDPTPDQRSAGTKR